MYYALIKNNQVILYPYTLYQFKKDNTKVSIPEIPTDNQLIELGLYKVNSTVKPQFNNITQKCIETTPKAIDGVWYQTWQVVDLSQDELNIIELEAKQSNKQEAERLLQETDYYSDATIGDSTQPIYLENYQDIVNYRMQLRLIAINPQVTVMWPEKPERIWKTN